MWLSGKMWQHLTSSQWIQTISTSLDSNTPIVFKDIGATLEAHEAVPSLWLPNPAGERLKKGEMMGGVLEGQFIFGKVLVATGQALWKFGILGDWWILMVNHPRNRCFFFVIDGGFGDGKHLKCFHGRMFDCDGFPEEKHVGTFSHIQSSFILWFCWCESNHHSSCVFVDVN